MTKFLQDGSGIQKRSTYKSRTIAMTVDWQGLSPRWDIFQTTDNKIDGRFKMMKPEASSFNLN
jgi:hypothetical protein